MTVASRRWASTDVAEEIPPEVDKIPDFNPKTGNHLWLMHAAFKVDPATWRSDVSPKLDGEALVALAGPGCFYCEQPYALVKHSRCKGKP
jgi:hypothetical protein